MAFQYINTGTSANKGDGDSLRLAFQKINYNFGQISAQGLTTSTVTVLSDQGTPVVDIKVYSGSFTLPINPNNGIELFNFDSRVYRSASIDIFARDVTRGTQDSATGYFVTWNSGTTHIAGTGIVSLFTNGNTDNAVWDLKQAPIIDSRVRVQAFNVSNHPVADVINWQAKVNLFRL